MSMAFSSHARRCFLVGALLGSLHAVFFVCAEVFLAKFKKKKGGTSFLRVSGGVSNIQNDVKVENAFSPRKR